MRILHISTLDNVGGAALAAYRLHLGLQHIGEDSSMFVAKKFSDDPKVTIFKPPMDFLSRLHRRLRRDAITHSFEYYEKSRPSGYEQFTDDRNQYSGSILEQLPQCDIINLHWIANFIDYEAFFTNIPQNIPIVWTLHDMNAFTGGCHYDLGCGKYNDNCGACPQLGSNNSKDLSHQIWKHKQNIYEQIEPNRLHIVTPSTWLAKEAKNSILLKRFPISTIPYGLDIDKFAIRDSTSTRDALGIPSDANIILFVAVGLDNKRKGFSLLTQALVGLADIDNLYLISVGNGKPITDNRISHLHLGSIENERLLSLIYALADIFIIPSLQDNLPNTVLEAMACGTSIIGFDVGGIPDMVRPNITGLLVPAEDIDALREAIVELLEDSKKRTKMSHNCRRIIIEEYTMEIQAKNYLELYKKMIHS